MASEIRIPRLGWNMEEGTFLGWLKRDGDVVKAGEALFTLEGDKAVQDIEALEAGLLRIAQPGPSTGDTIAVGALIGHLAAAGEVIAAASPVKQTQVSPMARPASPSARKRARELRAAAPAITAPARQAVSPRARRIAREQGVDLTELKGTGRNGRIRARDVQPQAGPSAGGQTFSPLRRTIGQRLLHSLRNTAPVTLTTTADATNLVSLRAQFQSTARLPDAPVPTYTDLLVKLTAHALARHPELNARWDGDQLLVSADIHIGIAVDTEAGLLVPVLRDVPRLSVRQVAARTRELAEQARRRTLPLHELQGGTFTITNLGQFGIDAFTPLLNWPECAILGVGRIQKQPLVLGDQIVPRDQITLSLTFDHRALDGAPAARFLQTLCEGIANPGAWLVH
jgi:pyruvate dehydrogenase E2 component (dihydrolipoamide acetyltransferase)